MKKFLKNFLFYLITFTFFTFLYLLSFKLNLNNFIDVYTYKGIFLLFVICILIIFFFAFIKKVVFKTINIKDIVIFILIFAFSNLLFFCMVPVTIERSFSVFMLSEMSKQDNQSLSIEQTKSLFMR